MNGWNIIGILEFGMWNLVDVEMSKLNNLPFSSHPLPFSIPPSLFAFPFSFPNLSIFIWFYNKKSFQLWPNCPLAKFVVFDMSLKCRRTINFSPQKSVVILFCYIHQNWFWLIGYAFENFVIIEIGLRCFKVGKKHLNFLPKVLI